MKKFFLLLLILNALTAQAADSYATLWQRYQQAKDKWQPRTAITALDQIISKATEKKDYGHLIKAESARAEMNISISTDSMDNVIARLQKGYSTTRDRAAQAVYAAVIGQFYETAASGDAKENARLSQEWFAKALSNKKLLAQTQARTFEPLVEHKDYSREFDNDLLHIIAITAHAYTDLHRYYVGSGNRRAACMAALLALRNEKKNETTNSRKSKHLQQIDSLIQEYQDLPEAGELAIEHYNVLNADESVTTEERIQYIDQAIARWGTWPRMNELRNKRAELTTPVFSISLAEPIMLPGQARMVRINSIRNINQITLNVYKINKRVYEPSYELSEKEIKSLKETASKTPMTIVRKFHGLPDYKLSSDSATITPLPLGCYLVEATTDAKGIKPQYAVLFVTDMHVITQNLPGKKTRFVVVSGTTGEPIPMATLTLRDEDEKTFQIKTNAKGEAIHKNTDYSDFRAESGKDIFAPFITCSKYSRFNTPKRNASANLFTDRTLYRPGQNVQVALVAYDFIDRVNTAPIANKQFKLTLRDQNKLVAEQTVTTNEWGNASTTFQLPTTGLPGTYYIYAAGEPSASTTISVEEYKRPTFRIEFDTIRTAYAEGDTVLLTGRAISFSGTAISGAKISTQAACQPMRFWWRTRSPKEVTVQADTLTDASGCFSVRVPITVPFLDEKVTYYNFIIACKITDNAGETHEARTYIPLSLNPTTLECDLPERFCRDTTCCITFAYTNNQWHPIPGHVVYSIGGQTFTTDANTKIDLSQTLSSLPSGEHHLHAVCGNDTIDRQVVVFGMDDDRVPIQTRDWFYISGNRFTNDNKVQLRLGTCDADQHVVYSIFAGSKLLESGSLNLKGKIYARDFTYKPAYGDALTLTYAWVRNGVCYSHTTHIDRPLPNRQLVARWKTFRNHLQPGQHETWTLHVERPNGTPAAANLIATLYDKSLDMIRSHYLSFNVYCPLTEAYGIDLASHLGQALSLYGEIGYKALSVEDLKFSSLYSVYPKLEYSIVKCRLNSLRRHASAPMVGEVLMAKSNMPESEVSNDDALSENEVKPLPTNEPAFTGSAVRQNFSETAFFYPHLTTNDKGDIDISFTLPESVTTWQFRGFLHDKNINYAMIEDEAVAQKPVMIQPNMPRFVRPDDQATIMARISNTSSQSQSGIAILRLTTPDTQTEVWRQEVAFSVAEGETTSVTFNFTLDAANSLLVCTITAEGANFSDGEQHYLPILPATEQVINTLPFTLTGVGSHTLNLSSLFDRHATQTTTTIEYTDNPAWLMVQALPALATPDAQNAISLVAAYYANAIARHIVASSPAISKALQLWSNQPSTSFLSELEKNQDLKIALASETPWLLDAANDTERMRNLARFLDVNQLQSTQASLMTHLQELQTSNGAFSWWKGMSPSSYITTMVVETLVRLQHLVGSQPEINAILTPAFSWLDAEMNKRVSKMRKDEAAGHSINTIGELGCHYLYASALAGRKPTENIHYLLNILEKQAAVYTIYGKANSAVILSLYGRTTRAAECLQSAREFTVFKEGMGRYYDTPLAEYSWADYRIPSQVATIEALRRITPADTLTINEMCQWLLQEKRATAWNTPINSVDAIFAFLQNNMTTLTPVAASTTLLDGKHRIDTSSAVPLIGTLRYQHTGAMRSLTIQKADARTSWGAAYATSLLPIGKVKQQSAGFTVKREVICTDEQPRVGSKVKVRITIRADRDYDFVQLVDKRAACLEPTQQLSGYNNGYYYAPHDYNTSYYFDRMSKGTHVVETTYYIDRPGSYQMGSCTVQCAYSPSFMGRAASQTLQVKP